MAGKTSTLELPYPVEGESADVPRDIKALAEKLEGNLKAIPLSQLAHGTSGQLIVVQGTGAAAYKALKGDATFAEDGTLTIGAGAITPSKVAAATNATVTTEELPTPTRRGHSLTGTSSVKTIGAGQSGQLVTYVNSLGTVTFKTGGNLRLASEFAAGVSDSITFAYSLALSQWCEVCRSNNV